VANPAPEEPAYALKAQQLNNCPFYSKGDSLHVRMPGVFGGGAQFCSLPVATFIPIALEGKKTEGNLEAGFKQCSCRWSFCKVEKMQHALVEMEDALTAEDQMQLSFLEQLPAPVLRALKERSVLRNFTAGAIILEGDTPASEFHVVLKGTARIATPGSDGRVIELNVLRRGDCFGEMSILTGAATSNRVEAVDVCMTLVMPRAALQKLVVDFPVLSIILYRMLSKRIRTSNQRLFQLLAPTLLGDLAHLNFIDLAQTIHTSRLSGILQVEDKTKRIARFGFNEGHLLYAEVPPFKGLDAIDDVVRWKSGSFRFASGEVIPPANLDGDTMGLLLDAMRRLDESSILDRFDSV
jgi:CRP-like cAMP-binding protein